MPFTDYWSYPRAWAITPVYHDSSPYGIWLYRTASGNNFYTTGTPWGYPSSPLSFELSFIRLAGVMSFYFENRLYDSRVKLRIASDNRAYLFWTVGDDNGQAGSLGTLNTTSNYRSSGGMYRIKLEAFQANANDTGFRVWQYNYSSQVWENLIDPSVFLMPAVYFPLGFQGIVIIFYFETALDSFVLDDLIIRRW